MMTNSKILEMAIELAKNNGWGANYDYQYREDMGIVVRHQDSNAITVYSTKDIIFDHDFAKALWGNPSKNKFGDLVHGIPDDFNSILYEWQYQLQQMVIAPDPIKYLGENITEIKEK